MHLCLHSCVWFLFCRIDGAKNMLAKKKHNMFISFRYEHPRNMEDQIRLDVRRGLVALKCNTNTIATGSDEDSGNIDELRVNLSIDEMTSNDICKDNRAHYLAHDGILKDFIYTKKCWKAICCNRHLFKDKIVLDVSCGLGMLSMFSAIAGAEHVYAIDTSNVVQLTRRIVPNNKLTHKITVIKGKAAEITLPVDKVDVIVSTFFGYALLYGNRLDELIDARNKWLTQDGFIFPDQCNCYMIGINNKMLSDRSNFWQHVYTFDMQAIVSAVISEPYFQHVNCDQVVTNPCLIKHINMYTVEKCDYRRYDTPFRLECQLDTDIGALVTYFDVVFNEGLKPITFTTTPGLPPKTRWKPLVFFLDRKNFKLNKGDRFYGVFRFNALNDDFRKIDWTIEVMHKSEHKYFRDNWLFKTR